MAFTIENGGTTAASLAGPIFPGVLVEQIELSAVEFVPAIEGDRDDPAFLAALDQAQLSPEAIASLRSRQTPIEDWPD